MSEKLPQLKALEAFVHAGRLLSFGKAAERMGLSASAVSRLIRTLELDLGLSLFIRRSRSVELTPEGERYLGKISPAFSAISEATAELRATRARLIISAPQAFAVSWLTPRLNVFRDRHPEIDIELSVCADITGRYEDSFDIGVFLAREHWPERHVELLHPISTFPVCSPALARNLTTPQDLLSQTLLQVRQLPNAWGEWLSAAGMDQSAAERPQKEIHFNDVQLAYEAAQNGLGVAVGADVIVEDRLADGRLVAPFELRKPSAYSYYLVCSKRRRNDPEVRAFRRWVQHAALPV